MHAFAALLSTANRALPNLSAKAVNKAAAGNKGVEK
jgi:hypothetical protein